MPNIDLKRQTAWKTPFLGCAYYPEAWDEDQLSHDIEMMQKAGITCARVGEFAWRKMEPARGRFEFDWLHRVVSALGRAGIAVVLCTPTATPPVWLCSAFPDVLKQNPDGTRMTHGSRRHCCSNNPRYLEASDTIVDALGKEFGADPNVIGWQLDNEILSWGVGCTCEYCLNAYHERLKKKYGAIENLNARWDLNLWSQSYDSFDEIPGDFGAWHNPQLKFEWVAAHYEADIAFIHRQADILRRYAKAPIGTDMMPTCAMGYEEMNEKLDVVMFNHYNTPENLSNAVFWFDYLRTLKDRPFWNTETAANWNGGTAIGQALKPEGFCRVNAWLPVALGGESNMFWLWRQHRAGHELMHGALLSPAGRPTHIFSEVRRTAEEYALASDIVAETKVQTSVALHFTNRAWQLFDQQKIFEGNSYAGNVQAVHRALVACGVRPDVIGAAHSLSAYKLLISPCVITLQDHDLAKKIRAFVENGGVWLAGPMTDIRNDIGAHFTENATGFLEEWLGAELTYSVPTDGTVLTAAWENGEALPVRGWAELYTISVGESLAKVTGGHTALVEKSLISRHKIGKGEVILCGALTEGSDLEKLLKIALTDTGVPTYSVRGELQVVPRRGTAGDALFLCETGGAPASLRTDKPLTDLLTKENFRDTVPVEPYGVRILI